MKIKKINKLFFQPKNNYEQVSLKIYFLLVENFSKTFFVGGMVRDLILNKKIIDIDIVTSAIPEEVIKLLNKHGYKTDSHAKSFGVIKVNTNKGNIEIATMRTEQYSNTRYPKVKFINSLIADSKRRDFTINSLYFDAKSNIIYDPQNGLEDLNKKQIKIVSKADIKLQEDPLRIIRAYRFSKQFNFKFETKTETALKKYFHLINKISETKLQSEINKATNLTTKKYLLQLIKNS
jgi:tRNA nucleotidyltransferase (CCA-adding enzyme)